MDVKKEHWRLICNLISASTILKTHIQDLLFYEIKYKPSNTVVIVNQHNVIIYDGRVSHSDERKVYFVLVKDIRPESYDKKRQDTYTSFLPSFLLAEATT